MGVVALLYQHSYSTKFVEYECWNKIDVANTYNNNIIIVILATSIAFLESLIYNS